MQADLPGSLSSVRQVDVMGVMLNLTGVYANDCRMCCSKHLDANVFCPSVEYVTATLPNELFECCLNSTGTVTYNYLSLRLRQDRLSAVVSELMVYATLSGQQNLM